MKQLRYILLLSILVLLYGCVQTPDPDYPKRINYILNVSNVGNTIHAGQDSLVVDEIKLLANRFNLLFSDDGTLQSEPDGLIMAYGAGNNGEDELVLGAQIGFEVNNFNGLELFIEPPADEDNIGDTDFFGDEGNYSFIIKGEHNSKSFTYRSGTLFEKVFEFEEVELTDAEPTIFIRMLLDIEDIMMDDSDMILDPDEQNNKAVIDSLLQTAIEVQAFSDNRLFEQ